MMQLLWEILNPQPLKLHHDISIEMRYPTYRKMMSNSSILSEMHADQNKGYV